MLITSDYRDTHILDRKPDPDFDNSGEKGSDMSVVYGLEKKLTRLGARATFGGGEANITMTSDDEPGLIIEHRGISAPLHIDNIVCNPRFHDIGLRVGQKAIGVVEHIAGIAGGLGMDMKVALGPGCSFPTSGDEFGRIARLIAENRVKTNENRQVFTVASPTRIDFGNERGSYVILSPEGSENAELIFDIQVDYPDTPIGKQRVRCKINDDLLLKWLSRARTASYGSRRFLLHILNCPLICHILRNFVDIRYGNIMEFGKNDIVDEDESFYHKGEYLELIIHEVLDKLGAFCIQTDAGRFVGTVTLFATSHPYDVSVIEAFQDGRIPIIQS